MDPPASSEGDRQGSLRWKHWLEKLIIARMSTFHYLLFFVKHVQNLEELGGEPN